jgi:hypothetical protein
MTTTCLERTCHARMSEPPPWISGYDGDAVAAGSAALMALRGTALPLGGVSADVTASPQQSSAVSRRGRRRGSDGLG